MGSIRRVVTGFGMAGLLWLGVQLVRGSVSLADAGIRAMLLLVAVNVTIRLADKGMHAMVRSLQP